MGNKQFLPTGKLPEIQSFCSKNILKLMLNYLISSYFILHVQYYLLQSENISMTSNIFISTLSRLRMNQTIHEIAQDAKKQFNTTLFKGFQLRINELLQKYQLLENKYTRFNCTQNSFQWKEDEKKLLLCFLLAFCHMYFKKVSEITNIEWAEISSAFHNKNILLMRYQAKLIQRNCQRVHWDEKQQLLLQKHIRNGMLGKWADISRGIYFESEGEYYKTPKQCRQHWFNHMNHSIKHGEWEVEQDLIILESALDYGHKWARVVDLLDGKRTEHMIKNRFHSLMSCCTKILQNSPQGKNQAKLIKILINQLHQKKKYLKKHQIYHFDPVFHGKIKTHKAENSIQKGFQAEIKLQQQKQVKASGSAKEKPGNFQLEEELTINENKIITKTKSEAFIGQGVNYTFPIYFQYGSNYINSYLSPIVVSPIFPGVQVLYHHI